MENLIHAYLLSGPVDLDHYVATPATFGSVATMSPDDYASNKARLLYSVDICGFAVTDYIVLQEALVKEAAEISIRVAAPRAKRKTVN